MDAKILQELEIAAQILLAPPNLVGHQQREAAESVFLNFKKTKSPYILCKYILETSKVDYVLFEVAGLLKEAVIREWTYIEPSCIDSLQQYLLQYVTDRSGTMAPFVREKILQVIGIMVKKKSVEDNGAGRGLLLNEIENLIMNGDHSRRLLGCGIIASLVQEYSMTSKSTDIGLTREKNTEAKERFELTDLKRIFQFCCKALNSLGNSESSFPEDSMPFIKQLLAILEAILTWNFTAHLSIQKAHVTYLLRNYESEPSPKLKLCPIWKDAILDCQIVNFFLMVYWKIRSNPQLSHHALTCLMQLASLNGTIFENEESRVHYLINYVEGFVKLTKSVEILDREALGISTIVRKICSPFLLVCLPFPLLNSFLEQLTVLTCNFAEGAATEETMCADDRLYMEAFDHMMEGWLNILNDLIDLKKDYYLGALIQIFNVYLKCHLAPPEGTRGIGRDLEPEEFDESDDTDRVKFQDQLQTIGVFGRHCPDHCLPLLARLLEDRTKQLSSHFNKLHRQQTSTISDSSTLVLLFEDLHWLLLIAGNVISTLVHGELNFLPFELMNYSIAQSSSVSIEISLEVFGSPNKNLDEIQDAELKTDKVIRLISAVFRLSYLFKTFIEAKMMQFLSPEVVSSMLWFLKQWAKVYLFLNEEHNTDLSMPFICAFGRDSEGGAWAINYLLEQVVTYLLNFHSEPGVIQDTVDLFTCLVDDNEKGVCVLKSENLRTIIMIQENLPMNVRRGVMSGLTLVSYAIKDSISRNEYLQQILKPLQNRLQSLLAQENFNRISHEEKVKTEILDILECMIGVAMGSSVGNRPSIFPYLSPMLLELSNLMKIYHNYHQIVEAILRVLCKFVGKFISYLPESDKKKLYEASLETIQVYAKCNSGRLSFDSDSQDDSFTDILLLMELLTNLLSKNLIDFSTTEPETENNPPVKAADVCLYGLNIILPLVTADLVKYPALCLQYFTLIKCVHDFFPEKVCVLPENFLKTLLSSVEMGLTSFGQEIIPYSCDFIRCVGWQIFSETAGGEAPHQALKPFLKLLLRVKKFGVYPLKMLLAEYGGEMSGMSSNKLLFDLILSGQMSADYIPTASSALFPLICCYPDEYRFIVQTLLAAQTDLVVRERLAKSFNELTENISLKCERRSQHGFRANFEKFYSNVRGFFTLK